MNRTPLWQPSRARQERSRMAAFMRFVNSRTGLELTDYEALWQWSVDHIEAFWELFWEFAQVRSAVSYERVVDHVDRLPGARWFPGARLNFAQNLLRYRDERTALVGVAEHRPTVRLSYAELVREVARTAAGLQALGVGPGDCVAAYMPNIPETIIAMLAATALGATWTSTSPDFGRSGVLARFGQTRPKVLFAADGYSYNGKQHDRLDRIRDVVAALPELERVIIVPFLSPRPAVSAVPRATSWAELREHRTVDVPFVQLPADHPLYIMYSSGTTGLPKCLVQSAGGILLHHLKELMLHADVTRDDVFFYYTTCGWMMWNWMVSGLACGATLVLYDGSPFHPDPLALWRLAQDEGITIFGTGARYLEALARASVRPCEAVDLGALKTVLSTGSPLCKEGFEYVYRDIKADVQLSSISGGTDLNGCLAIGNPLLPVYSGELQCRPLAMAVDSFDPDGRPVRDDKGELVCTRPFPSMPLGLFGDDDGSGYHEAYFARFPNVWHHGDYVMIRSDTGGLVVFGRSDTTLNPGGVRIGTAEIYPAVESIAEIEDSLVVGQRWEHDVRVVLFVKMCPGHDLTDAIRTQIRTNILAQATRRHLPAKIVAVPDIPYTISGKKVELAVRKAIHGEPVTNKDALRNPEAVEFFEEIPELQQP